MTRVATLNLPAGSKGFKARLYANPRRTRAARHWLNTHAVSLAGLQEFATPSRIIWTLSPRWRYVATSNNIALPLLGSVGNAVTWRRDIWRKTGPRNVYRLTWGRRGLRIPSVILTHRITGMTVKVYSIHLPAGATHRDTREAMLDLIASDAEQYAGPVVMLGDFNDHRVRVLLMGRLNGWHVIGDEVDWIAVLGPRVVGSAVHHEVRGKFTDHPIVTADIRP